jgi:nucleoside-diphosphate-sugar epimerase
MHILITGAAGMLGRRITERLLEDGRIGDRSITKLTLHDVTVSDAGPTANTTILPVVGDISDASVASRLVAEKPDMVLHLAAIVSGEAEADFERGYAVNFDGPRHLFEAIRTLNYQPRVVYASSIAVFGAPFPEPIPDEFHLTPLTSYGTQKAVGELLLNDYSRRGIFDGIGLRLPTICVRPGKPNKAASGFFSNIIREPLKGEAAVLPVSDTLRHWHASPRAAVGFFLRAMQMDLDSVGPRRCITMPGVSVTVAGQIEALRKVAGEAAVKLIRREPDPVIERIVSGWPTAFEAKRARDLGFTADKSFAAIIRAHIEDEHGGRAPIEGAA